MTASRTLAASGYARWLVLATSSMSGAHTADLVFADDLDLQAGAGPTQACTISPDPSGFFTRTGPNSSVRVVRFARRKQR